MPNINFFTPVVYPPQATAFEKASETVDSYFSRGDRQAVVVTGKEGNVTNVRLQAATSHFFLTSLVLASYFTLIVPLVLLIVTAVLRSQTPFTVTPGGDATFRSSSSSSRRALSEEGGDDGHQDCGNDDLRDEGQPETVLPTTGRGQCQTSGRAEDADEHRQQASDRLHAGHQNPCDEPDHDSGEQSTENSGEFHSPSQPFAW